MTTTTLVDTARAIVADGKGLLAADETVPTITRRLAARTIESTGDSRRAYGLRDRLTAYREIGARFAKWRAVILIGEGLPTAACVHSNAHALARYAALCQEQGLVPIVEPEVLMKGMHTMERCATVTERVLHAVFNALFEHDVSLEGMLLKPNMVVPGQDCPRRASVKEVAVATLRTIARHVPPAVPAIVFLSGGQDHVLATQHLSAINQLEGPKPWKLSYSYGRALQDEALEVWRGRSENVLAGQHAFYHRAKCDSAAALGRYRTEMEIEEALA